MVIISFDPVFERRVKKIKSQQVKNKIKKQIAKIVENPETGKPMRYLRKGTREVYLDSFRLSYLYLKEEDKFYFLVKIDLENYLRFKHRK